MKPRPKQLFMVSHKKAKDKKNRTLKRRNLPVSRQKYDQIEYCSSKNNNIYRSSNETEELHRFLNCELTDIRPKRERERERERATQ
jgi:hypothetical protein